MQTIDRLKKAKLISKLAKESKSAKSVGEMEVPSVKIMEETEIEAPVSSIKQLDLPVSGIKKIDTSVPLADRLKSMEVKGIKKPMARDKDIYDVDIEGPIGGQKYSPIMEYMKKKRGV
jgi:hypothetical protein